MNYLNTPSSLTALVCTGLITLVGAGCASSSQYRSDPALHALPNSSFTVSLPKNWEVHEVSSTNPGIYSSRFPRYWFAGTQENFDHFQKSMAGPALDYFYGCVIGEATSSNSNKPLSRWMEDSGFYSDEDMLHFSGSQAFGSASSSDAIVVSESGENATHSETIYVKKGEYLFGLSSFTDLDTDPRDRALLPGSKAGCEQIARSLMENR